jgi:glycosyltransferase involved in cell wall biosynthesis
LEAAPEVLRRVPDARFLIIGDGELRAELEAKGCAASGRVSFLGHRADALQYVALADVFVMSSKEEGLGTAILDALAVGVPTVATRAGGIPDIYGSPEAPELVPPGDPAALAEALARVLTDPQEALRRVERGRGLVERFTVSGMTDAYEKIYKDVLNA